MADGMYVTWGGYEHDSGEVQINWRGSALQAATGEVYAQRRTIDLFGVLQASSQTALHAKIGELLEAYSEPGRDLTLRFANGTPSHLSLKSAECIGGTRVVGPVSFPSNRDGAYAVSIEYTVSVEGDLAGEISTNTLSFSETLTFSGGGPLEGYLEPRNARPVRQLLSQFSVYRATQSGTAVGLYRYPLVPAAIWPGKAVRQPKVVPVSPRRQGSGNDVIYTDFAVSWEYEFASEDPLVGTPTRWAI